LEAHDIKGARGQKEWMSKMLRHAVAALASGITAFAPTIALAHTDSGPTEGLLAGFVHPFAGLDHLAAMIAVGLWAAKSGGRAVFLLPAAFLATMALGAVLAWQGVQLPAVELALTASVIVVGILVALAVRVPSPAAAAMVAAFALFHGHAHGHEMASGSSALAYGAGFLAATALLHAAGIVAGRTVTPRFVRLGGGAVVALGLVLVAA
jgi:urease accessory protein